MIVFRTTNSAGTCSTRVPISSPINAAPYVATFGGGFGRSTLFLIRAFYLACAKKVQTVFGQFDQAYFKLLRLAFPLVAWLNPIRDHIATSRSIDPDDFEFAPFNQRGGLGKAHQLFGEQLPKSKFANSRPAALISDEAR